MQSAPTYSGEAGAPETQDTLDPQEVLAEFNRRLKHCKAHWNEWRTEARDLYDLVAGRQWDEEDAAKLREELRPMVTFNVSGKYMDAITGLQINNRQDIRFFPREIGDAQVNEILTGAVTWGRDLCDVVDEETDAFYDAVLTGLGWMEGYLDKDLEPDGVPAGQRVDNMEMYADPAARKRNLEDARYVIRIRQMDHDEYKELFGDEYGAADEDLVTATDDDGDITVIESPQDYGDESSTAEASQKKGKCPVADYQFWRKETRYLLRHPQLGERELTEKEHEAYQDFFQRAARNGQRFQITKIRRKVYYRAFIAKGRIATGENGFGLSPYQYGFTYHAITGKRDRNKNTWYGIGRAILDPQKWLNKFFSTILYTIQTNAQGGVLAEENAFKDARKAESEWARPDRITWLKGGALSGQNPKVIPKPAAQYPTGLDRLMEFTLQGLPQTTGIPVELMGLTEKVQSGVLEAQRKQSAMAIVAWAFDAMRRYYRSMGKQMACYVVDYLPEGTLVMINGEQSRQYVPIVKNRMSKRFDVIVDEAPTSTNMKERVWAVLEVMIPNLIQAGITIPPEVLDYSPLPSDLAQKWKQALQPDPKKQQYEEQRAMAELGKEQATAQEKGASAQLKQAQAAKAMAEAQMPDNSPQKAMLERQTALDEARIDQETERFKAEKKAETEIIVAQIKAAVDRQLGEFEARLTAQLNREQAQTSAALQHEKNHLDADVKKAAAKGKSSRGKS